MTPDAEATAPAGTAGDATADDDVAADGPAPVGAAAPGRRSRRRRAPRARRSRRRIWLGLGIVVVALGAYAAWAAVALLQVRSDALDAVDRLEAIRDDLSATVVVNGGEAESIAALRDAEAQFRAAHDAARNPFLVPLRAVPWGGRQLRSVIALTGSAADVADVGADTLAEVRAALDEDDGVEAADRVVLLERVEAIVGEASARLARVDLGPGDALHPALAEARAEFATELADIRETVDDAAVISAGMRTFFAGPSRYLLVAANQTQMRVGAGMFLEAGVLTVEDGDFTIGVLRSPNEIQPTTPADVDPDLGTNWGFLTPQLDLRGAQLTARFDASAPAIAAIWQQAGYGQVDGVLAVDPVALQAVMRSTGSVEAGGSEITVDTILPFLFHDQYVDLVSSDGVTPDEAARDEVLGELAARVLDGLGDGGWDPVELAESLADAAEGRHVLAWARDEAVQAAWVAAGIDGSLRPDSLVVAVANQGANKLDQFLAVTGDLAVVPDADGGATATLTITLRNRTPDGEPTYVAGPDEALVDRLDYGDYAGFLVVNLPGAATDVAFDGVTSYAVQGPDGPTQVRAVPVLVAQGGVLEQVVRFRLPAGVDRITVEPSARALGIEWSTPDRAWTDAERVDVTW